MPELKRSVFVVPAAEFKGERDHVLILNNAAWSIVEACRGQHEEYVLVYHASGKCILTGRRPCNTTTSRR